MRTMERWTSVVLATAALAVAHASGAGDWPYAGSSGAPTAGDAGTHTQAILSVAYMDSGGIWRNEALEQGLFGRGRVGGAVGLLVPLLVGPQGERGGAACSPPVSAARGVPPGEPWIALVQRGACDYDVQVEHAARLSAAAVVVYNNRDSPALERMPLSEKRNISGVFITKKRGEFLVGLVNNSSLVYLNISVGATHARPYNINRPDVIVLRPRLVLCDAAAPAFHCVRLTSVLFVSISFIVLMMISLAWLVFYYVQRFRYIHAKDRLSRRLCSAARKALSKIPTKIIKSDDKEVHGDGECCAVCIEPYKISDVLRILPCRHEFHKSCIDPWLLEHRTCPMCKMDILKHYGFVFTGSQESILHMEIEEVAGLSPTGNPESGNIHSSGNTATLGRQDSEQQSQSSPHHSQGEGRLGTSSEGCSATNMHSHVTEDSEGTSRIVICSSCDAGTCTDCPSNTYPIDEPVDLPSRTEQECSLYVCNINNGSSSNSNSNNSSSNSGSGSRNNNDNADTGDKCDSTTSSNNS